MGDERAQLYERAAHVIDGVLRRYVGEGSLESDEADDVRAVVMLRLAQRFGGDVPDDIRSLEDFVATMAHNAARDVFRGRRPERTRLRKRVRAIVREDPRFVLLGDGTCALHEYADGPRIETVVLTHDDFAAARTLPLDETIALLLGRARGAIHFEQLFDLLADATGLPLGPATVSLDDEPLVDAGPEIETQLIARETLHALWNAIRALPLPQRTALLLHLRDDRGASAIPLLVFTGTATLDEIGAILEIDRSRMERLWDELPLADIDIGRLLKTSSSRVVGLRRAARERLGRFLRRGGLGR